MPFWAYCGEDMRPLHWIASSQKDYLALPDEVQDEFGYALFVAQKGEYPDIAKPLKGFGSASVLELVQRFDGATFRAVYTVRLEEAVYVLHSFQKKSKSRIGTPKLEIALIKARLKLAEEEHERWKRTKT
jgi:phage-related protein